MRFSMAEISSGRIVTGVLQHLHEKPMLVYIPGCQVFFIDRGSFFKRDPVNN
jgi:hypothetical protein